MADIHIGPEAPYEGKIRKLSRFSLDYLDALVERFKADRTIAFVGQLGDLIEDSDAALDRQNIKAGVHSLSRFSQPVLHVLGNHEQVNLSVPELCALIGRQRPYYSVRLAAAAGGKAQTGSETDLTLIVLFSASRLHTDIHIDDDQIDWLRGELRAAPGPVLVLVHHPLDEQSLIGNIWFEKYPDYCYVEERAAVRAVLEESGKVLAVFGGHVHQNSVSTINGIVYCTVQSLVESVSGDIASGKTSPAGSTPQADTPQASGAYALVEIECGAGAAGKMIIDVFGLDPLHVELPLKTWSASKV